MRLTNSILACRSVDGGTNEVSQVGQSVQPRPEPVSRTAAPVTTIAASEHERDAG